MPELIVKCPKAVLHPKHDENCECADCLREEEHTTVEADGSEELISHVRRKLQDTECGYCGLPLEEVTRG